MDGDVGFTDDGDGRDAYRREFVGHRLEDGAADGLGDGFIEVDQGCFVVDGLHAPLGALVDDVGSGEVVSDLHVVSHVVGRRGADE